MANFALDLLGGLAQAGAQGGTGAVEGLVQGETLRRKFSADDLAQSLQMLDMELKRRAAGSPTFKIGPGGHVYQFPAALGPQGPPSIVPGSQPPMTPLDRSRMGYYDARATAAGQPKSAPPPQLSAAERMAWEANQRKYPNEDFDTFYQKFMMRQAPAPQLDAWTAKRLSEWQADPRNAGKTLTDFERETYAARREPPRDYLMGPNMSRVPYAGGSAVFTTPPAPVSRIETFIDEKGVATPTGMTYTPFGAPGGKGKMEASVPISIGKVGKPASARSSADERAVSDYIAGTPGMENTPATRTQARLDLASGKAGAAAKARAEAVAGTTLYTKTIPRSPIRGAEEMKRIEDEVQGVADSILKGWAPPSSSQKLPDGRTITRTEAVNDMRKKITEAFRERYGVDIEVEWKPGSVWGGTWKIVRAWEPERVGESTSERVKP